MKALLIGFSLLGLLGLSACDGSNSKDEDKERSVLSSVRDHDNEQNDDDRDAKADQDRDDQDEDREVNSKDKDDD